MISFASGRRRRSSRAVASPRMPPPMIAMSPVHSAMTKPSAVSVQPSGGMVQRARGVHHGGTPSLPDQHHMRPREGGGRGDAEEGGVEAVDLGEIAGLGVGGGEALEPLGGVVVPPERGQ